MSDVIDQAAALLFPEGTRGVSNIKFFLGSRRDLTAEELAGEVIRIESLVADGRCHQVEDIDGDLDE